MVDMFTVTAGMVGKLPGMHGHGGQVQVLLSPMRTMLPPRTHKKESVLFWCLLVVVGEEARMMVTPAL